MNLFFETKYALRHLIKTPLFTGLGFLVTSLSIGISVIVFTFVYTFSLKPLDFPESSSWYMAQYYDTETGFPDMLRFDSHAYQALAESSLSSVEKFRGYRLSSSTLSEGPTSIELSTAILSPELLSETNAIPALGRILVPSDSVDQTTVMLSYDTWQNYFGGNSDIANRQIIINGEQKTVVGILPKGYDLVMGAHIWMPLSLNRSAGPNNVDISLPIVKLNKNTSIQIANREFNEVLETLQDEFPDFYRENKTITLTPLKHALDSYAGPMYKMISIVAGILTLFGSLNIGTLLFSKLLERQQEVIIRKAIGSSVWQLTRQNSLISLLVCVSGTTGGLLIAYASFGWFNSISETVAGTVGLIPPARMTMHIDTTTILFSVVMCLLIWLISGLLPSWHIAKQDGTESLATGSNRSAPPKRFKATSYLVGFQVVFSCFLLIVSATLVLSFNRLVNSDKGIAIENISTASISFKQRYSDTPQRNTYLKLLQTELNTVEGIDDVAFTSALPALTFLASHQLNQRPVESENQSQIQVLVSVSNNYFNVLGINLLEGRHFSETDSQTSLPVVIVDEGFASLHWPNQSAIGKRIKIDPEQSNKLSTIIGVSRHVPAQSSLAPDNQFLVYRPFNQHSSPTARLVLKTSLNSVLKPQSILEASHRVDSDLPLQSLQSLEDYYKFIDGATPIVIANTILISSSLITLLLAIVGILAIMARMIIQNMPNIGVRRALGSSKQGIHWIYFRRASTFLVIGSVIGGGSAILVSSVIMNQVNMDVASSLIPISISVIGIVSIFTLLASYIPTKRAVHLEPGDALRYE